MIINIVKGTGEGNTQLSAFDKALLKAGIGNYNLIYLSSVIPKGSIIKVSNVDYQDNEYGNKLYVVISKYIETTVNNKQSNIQR